MAVTRVPIPDWAKTQKTDNRLELSLSEIDLVVRTVNCLEDHGIFTVQDLLNSTPKQLLEIPNLGEKTLETIYAALEKIGFFRPGRQPDEPVQFDLPNKNFALLDDEPD
jgi:DNA-directed RNA polymerase subunit alpha